MHASDVALYYSERYSSQLAVNTTIRLVCNGNLTQPEDAVFTILSDVNHFTVTAELHHECCCPGVCISPPKVSLMSHITKILLKIIMLRIRNKIKPEIAEEQCGFVEDKGTSNAIYILRSLIERALEVQKDVYLCFIDYTKAFDRVRHDEIITELKQLNIDGKDLRIIKTMYWEQTAVMRIENKISTFQDIKRSVRQGCVLSSDFFSLCSEIIMRNLENHPGIKVGGQNINNLRYADDTVLIAENKEDLQKLLNIVEEESRKKGLELNSKKTEVMVISRKQESPKCDIFINKVNLKQTEKFKYLGTIISNDGKTNREISARTAHAKINFSKDENNKHISIETRKRALQCYIEPGLMYGCEAWTISKQIQNKLEATEMWFLRRMLRIPWTAKKTNERILNEANKRRSLVRTIKKRQATFLGHLMRRGKLEHLVTKGKQRKTKGEDNGWTGHMAWTSKSVRYTGRRQR
ncbi:endonuclease-reverse transcriptase [Plakobranchus ocellatus]|uniref:Endonuclease-reverse transcriptase n=1 Tax=Plakobranchus ocellatus TaxID=259542 RepID=A0AAV4B599_9GAST|nr:endonuclease-reverse transcriptase [Plakobranchus ocellatus]